MVYSNQCGFSQSTYGKEKDISGRNYALSSQQYGSGGNAAMLYSLGSSQNEHINHSLQKSNSIDDLLPYQKMSSVPTHNNGFYQEPEARFYAPGQTGDAGEADYTRIQKGYGVNSQIEGQYGFKK